MDEYFDKNVGRVCVMDEYLPEKCGEYSSVGRVSSQHGASIPTAVDEYPVRNVGQIVVVLRVFVKSIRIRAECEKVNSNSRESHFVPAVYLIGQYLLVNVILVHVYATGDGVVVYCNIVYWVYCRR